MYKLDLEKPEEAEIKLSTSTGPQKKQSKSRKIFTCASLTMLKPLTVWITICGKFLQEMGISGHLTCLLRNLQASQEETEPDMKQSSFKLGKEYIKVVYCHHEKCWAR